ncbi:MAG: hypothetical protein RID09_20330 [Coleofasciculus sp. G1-WW12-02]|uniref:hypothetical protein n=1 Tax=Coleofasciculus sp. G1-WW12-02 TaxID=3068483 RepID=UPI0032F165C2
MFGFSSTGMKKALKFFLVPLISLVCVVGIEVRSARADLATSLEKIDATMTALEGISETGVGIVVVPFGIGFALKIAGHVLRAGT